MRGPEDARRADDEGHAVVEEFAQLVGDLAALAGEH